MRPDRVRLAILLLLAGAYRVSLLGRGAVAFVDETLYFKAAMALRALAAGHVRVAVFDLVTNNARPGDALLKLIPASLQAIALTMGYPVLDPTSLLIPTACNVLVSLILLWIVYRLCLVWTAGDEAVSLTVAAVYAMLPSSNVYIRHLFPYDWALTVALAVLWGIVALEMTGGRVAALAFLAGSVAVIYPGYYPLVGVLAVALLVRRAPIVIVAAGLAAPVLMTEALARWAGFSYLASARELSGTIVGGSFDEGWVFLPRYLIEVDRAGGIVLIAGAIAFAAVFVRQLTRSRHVPVVHWILAAAATGWAWQAILSSAARKMVLYGRLIHPWIALLAIALAVALHAIPSRQFKLACCQLALLAALVGLAITGAQYNHLAYPRDVLHALAVDPSAAPPARRVCEFELTQLYEAPPPARRETRSRPTDRLLMINMCQGNPTADRVAGVPSTAVPVFDGPHFEQYPAYQFEGYTPSQRAMLRARDYRVAVYELR
ncbi:MAG TPA: hypothetical protein VFA59_09475 [Vicinamibacterales bacterium]|nr:hypothetical protein [Vicinamibacterales bacterium]